MIEELGQVEFIFSDKTGTLTMNKMELKKCCINQTVYGNLEEGEENVEGICASSVKKLQEKIMEDGSTKDSRAVLNFLTALSVCHTVVVDKHHKGSVDGDEEMKDVGEGEMEAIYQSASPDELALVTAAKLVGFELHSRSTNRIRV